MKFPIIYGPTAVGKTELAAILAEYLPVEVISMDSRQVYKYMDIGTGKPSKRIRERVPHHLVDFLEPDQRYNAYLFRQDARRLVREILDRGKIPLIVGGTGLYADALLFGIIEGVPANERLRTALLNLERAFPGTLRRMLEKLDQESAARIHPNDIKRTIRAIEVRIIAKRRMSDLHREHRKTSGDTPFYVILLEREREDLYGRINERVLEMFEKGLVEETRRLLEMGYSSELDALQTIGYREVIQYINGERSLNETIRLVQRNTRHYARRQIMWGRRYRQAIRIDLSSRTPEQSTKEIVHVIKSRLGG